MNRQQILLGLATLASLGSRAAAQRPSGVDVSVHATVLVNGFRNSGRSNNVDVPTVALPPDPTALGPSNLGGSVRQTRLRIEARHESVLGGRLLSELDTDFFGGQQPSAGGRTHPVLRVRRAFAEVRWSGGSLLVGQEAPPIVGLSPLSIASSGLPLFASSGNLWLWLPQIRGTAWLNPGRPIRIGVEGAVLAPNAGEPVDPFLTQPDRAETTGRPALEGRLLAKWGAGQREGELGFGGHVGWLAVSSPSGAGIARVTARALAMTVLAPLGALAEVRGELFIGNGLSGLGGGGIGQGLNSRGYPIKTYGGWGQLVVRPAQSLEATAGYGIDDPRDVDLTGAAPRSRNRVGSVGLTWRMAPALAGIEVRRISTRYGGVAPNRARNTHVNVGLGIEF